MTGLAITIFVLWGLLVISAMNTQDSDSAAGAVLALIICCVALALAIVVIA